MKAIAVILALMLLNNCYSQDTITVRDKRPYSGDLRDEDITIVLHQPGELFYGSSAKLDTVIFARFIDSFTAIITGYQKSGISDLWMAKYKSGVIREIGRFYLSKRKYYTVKKVGIWLYFSEEGRVIDKVDHDKLK